MTLVKQILQLIMTIALMLEELWLEVIIHRLSYSIVPIIVSIKLYELHRSVYATDSRFVSDRL